jgi:hypothetical protein
MVNWRKILPCEHFTVPSNPAIFGDDGACQPW